MLKWYTEERALIPIGLFYGEIESIYQTKKIEKDDEIFTVFVFDVKSHNITINCIWKVRDPELGKNLYVGRNVSVETARIVKASTDKPGTLEYTFQSCGRIFLN